MRCEAPLSFQKSHNLLNPKARKRRRSRTRDDVPRAEAIAVEYLPPASQSQMNKHMITSVAAEAEEEIEEVDVLRSSAMMTFRKLNFGLGSAS